METRDFGFRTNRRIGGRYRLDARIASGATTSVWDATDLPLGRRVAVKRLRNRPATDPVARDRFAREIRLSARLDHPSIVTVLDADPNADQPYLVTEFVPGENLESLLRRGHLPPSTAIRIAEALARALSHVHDRGVIHCDVKPANVLVRNDGHVRLADFGIAVPVGAGHGGSVHGSIHYISPERLIGEEPSRSCDIYALGITLYEMLTGRRPFTGTSPLDVALAHRRGLELPAVTFGRIPAAVDPLLDAAVATRRVDRYPTAADFADALQAVDQSIDRRILAG